MAPKPKKNGSVSVSSFSYVSLLNNLLDRMCTKNPWRSGVKSAVDFNMAAGKNSKEKESCSTWKDEEVESLIDIFSEETIQFSLEKAKCPKDKNAVYNEVKVRLESQGICQFHKLDRHAVRS